MIGRLALCVLAGIGAWGIAENTRAARLRRALLVEWSRHLDEGLARSGRWS